MQNQIIKMPLFRCLILALPIYLFSSRLMLGQITPALNCQADADTPSLRSEGRTELIGDIRISCIGGTPGVGGLVNIQIFLGALVTNRIADSTNAVDAFLFIGEPSKPVLGTNLFQGIKSGPNTIVFLGVPLLGSNTPVVFRIVNVRADATVVLATTQGPQATAMPAYVSIGGNLGRPIVATQVNVGFIVPPQTLQIKKTGTFPSGPAALNVPSLSFITASGENQSLVTSSTAANGVINYQLRVDESFANEFRRRNTATTSKDPDLLSDQAVLGTNYGTETGYYNSTLPSAKGLSQAGLATQGTRIMIQFSNLPDGVALYATVRQLSTIGSANTTKATLVTTDAQGSGLFNPAAATTTASVTDVTGAASVAIAPLNIVNGAATAVWEVTDSDPAAVEGLTFGIAAAYSTAVSGTVAPVVKFGPLGGGVADATSPIPRFGSANSPQLLPQQTSFLFKSPTGPASQVLYLTAKGKQRAYTASVTTENGNWLSVTPNAGMTPANLQVTVNSNALAPGTYQGAVILGTTDINTSPIWLPVTLEVGPQRPQVTAVLNGASFASGEVAPGMLVSIMGSNLIGQPGSAVRVLFDNTSARIVSMRASQLNVMVPYGVANRSSTLVVIEVPGAAASAPFAIPVVAAAPGIFTANASGSGGAAALNTDQTLNTPSNAASRGSIVTLYATGAGQLTPQGVDGEVLSGPVAIPVQPVGVLVDGLPTGNEYQGNAPGLISGILQVNLRIPLDAPIGPAVPLVLTVGSGRSPAGVTIAVR